MSSSIIQFLPILTLFFLLNHLIHTYAGNFLTPRSPIDKIDNYEHGHSGIHLVTQESTHSAPKLGKLAFGRVNTIATAVTIAITLLNIIVYKLREIHEANLREKYKPSEQSCRRFLLADILSATRNFDDSLVVGQGGFGKVYRGVIDDGTVTVAIKRLNHMSKQGAPEFWAEIEMLSRIRHSNIVSLIGYCLDCAEMILVYDYMVHGTLADNIYRNSTKSALPWEQRVKICIGAARGLDYLHTGTSDRDRIIHRDVKSSNILLGENWTPKVSDFGMSKIGPTNQLHTHVSTNVKGTFGYLDPEYFLTHRLTRKSDVYAFGVVLFEVLCGRRAVDLSLDVEQRGLAGWAQQCIKEGKVDQIIDPSLKEEILSDSLTVFAEIADQCLHMFSRERPTMAEVVVALELALTKQERKDFFIYEEFFINTGGDCDYQEIADSSAYADIVKQIFANLIQLVDQVNKTVDEAAIQKQECLDLKSKTEKLAALLRQAGRASNDFYECPTRRIVDDTEQVLHKALALAQKCRLDGLLKRVFTIIPAAAFRKMSAQLEDSIINVAWLLRIFAPVDSRNDMDHIVPPIAANEPIIGLIWEQIALLYTGSLDERSDAAPSLVSIARYNDRYGKLIIEEGGVGPLLKLVKEGKMEGQENAARGIGLLGRDPESVEHMIHAGACSVFAKMLKEGPMKVQAVVAWAVSELAAHYPKCQDLFLQHNIIRLLVGHLAFETVQEHIKYAITSSKATSIHAVVLASNKSNTNNANKPIEDDEKPAQIKHPIGFNQPNRMHSVVTNTMAMKGQLEPPPLAGTQSNNVNVNGTQNHTNHCRQQSFSGTSIKGREPEDPATRADMKKMAARALWHLAKGNSPICRSITESRALLCFAVLLEKGPEDIKYDSAMALMEITAVAEHDAELRRTAFKPNSSACKAVIDQLLKIVEKADSELLLPCVKAIGNLARSFPATETRMISPLVRLLDEREAHISREAAIALTKFACTENHLHLHHCKAIISAGGAKHLIQLVYFGEQIVQSSAVVLLRYIALNVPDSKELAQAEVLTVLEWASKQANLIQDERVESSLQEAKSRLELYQSSGTRSFYNLFFRAICRICSVV